jgi:hypothetical protein
VTDPAATADEMIERYLSLKDHLAAQTKAFAEFCKPFRDEMEVIEGKLREILLAMGDKAEALKTANGTAYVSLITTPGIENRDQFIDWALDNWESGGGEMLQLGKPQVSAVKEYMEAHEGQLPPGVKISQFQQLNIRRS